MKPKAIAFSIGAAIATIVSFPWAESVIGVWQAIVLYLVIWILIGTVVWRR
jgi:hypothetical protein